MIEPAESENHAAAAVAGDLLSAVNVAIALLVGRSLAMMRHPVLGWPRLRPSGRVALAAGYAGLSYLTALFSMIAWHS